MNDVGWWARNSDAVTGLSTLALVAVTAVYAVLTRTIARAAESQAAVLNDELVQTKQVAREEREARERAEDHASRLLAVTVRSQVDARTPTVTVSFTGGRLEMMYGENDPRSPGTQTVDAFRGGSYSVVATFTIRNHGPGPTVLEVQQAPGGAIEPVGCRLLDEGETLGSAVRLLVSGVDLIAAKVGDAFSIEYSAQVESPLTFVRDEFHWSGNLVLPVQQGRVIGTEAVVNGVMLAERTRTFPEDL